METWKTCEHDWKYQEGSTSLRFCMKCNYLEKDIVPNAVHHPPHYTKHPSGIECIQIVEHSNFCIGSAQKYLWRTDLKGDPIENLEKAVWFIRREIERRKNGTK